jgi:hypothetical protein
LADYLLPISDRQPLAWIIAKQRTAVSARRRREAEALQPGDQVLLYTTRGCFRNPTRDRGRVIGLARVGHPARRVLDEPVRFGDREYPLEVSLKIESLAPRGAGVELGPLLDRLESFPNRNAWSAYLRRALVPITPKDAIVITEALDPIARGYRETASTYRT